MARFRSFTCLASHAPAQAPTTEPATMRIAALQSTLPPTPNATIAAAEDATIVAAEMPEALRWVTCIHRTRPGTTMTPPPTPNSPATMPAMDPRMIGLTRFPFTDAKVHHSYGVHIVSLNAMRTFLVLVLGLALAAAACGSADENPESSAPAVVAGWAEAVQARDFEAATDAVFEPSMVLVLAAENDLPASETAAMLTGGVTPAVAAAYWSSFRDGFGAFAGQPISNLNVGASTEVEAGGAEWSVVAVTAQDDATAAVFTKDADGWKVDLVATLADGFVEPLSTYLASLPDDDDGEAIRTAYEDVVVPAMWAAIEVGGHGDDFARRAVALIDASTP